MIRSFCNSLRDNTTPFVHLYEICDALKAIYGDARRASEALGIDKVEWGEFEKLCNHPSEQSRHRGLNLGKLERAAPQTIGRARDIARRWILAYARMGH